MKIIEQSYEILSLPKDVLSKIERAARTCYKSEDKIKPGSAEKLVQRLIDSGHEAMLEFEDITVKFITNRSVSHELVRHRLCSFAQESTRYVKYDGEMEFIKPVWWVEDTATALEYTDEELKVFPPQVIWEGQMYNAERAYQDLLSLGWKAQQAREVLPNSLKTEIVMKGNMREWRHIFKLRCDSKAHPQMYHLMRSLHKELKSKIPLIFDDIEY